MFFEEKMLSQHFLALYDWLYVFPRFASNKIPKYATILPNLVSVSNNLMSSKTPLALLIEQRWEFCSPLTLMENHENLGDAQLKRAIIGRVTVMCLGRRNFGLKHM